MTWVLVAVVLVLVTACAITMVYNPRYDHVVRRTNKDFPVGSVHRVDRPSELWRRPGFYRVTSTRPCPSMLDGLFGGVRHNVFLRRLKDSEALVHEVMSS